MTIQQPDLMGADEARQVTNGIRLALDRVSTAWADLAERISDAYQRRADLALGYGSWAEYADAELKPAEGLAAEVRRQLVGMLSQAGMSTRAIAPTVGVGQTQVRRDEVSLKGSPAIARQAARNPCHLDTRTRRAHRLRHRRSPRPSCWRQQQGHRPRRQDLHPTRTEAAPDAAA